MDNMRDNNSLFDGVKINTTQDSNYSTLEFNNNMDNMDSKDIKLLFGEKYYEKVKKTRDKKYKSSIKKNSIVPINYFSNNSSNNNISVGYNRKHIMNEGEKIYNENGYISKIWDIMSDDTFNSFFEEYLNNYSDVQIAMVFFNLYKIIKDQYYELFNKTITKEEMVYMLKNIMRDNFMRKYFIQSTKDNNLIHLDTDIMTTDIIMGFKEKYKNV